MRLRVRDPLWRGLGAGAVLTLILSAAMAQDLPAAQAAQPPSEPAASQAAPATAPANEPAPATAPAPAPATASGADDPLAGLYGNTLVARDDGIVSHFYYNADHTFTAKIPEFFMELKGTWYVAPDGQVCRVFDPPPPRMTNPDCGPMRVRKVGDKVKDEHGDTQKLVAGID